MVQSRQCFKFNPQAVWESLIDLKIWRWVYSNPVQSLHLGWNFQIFKSSNHQINLVFRSLIYFFLVSGLIEGLVIFYILKNRKYVFAVAQSLLINGLSLLVSLIVWPYIFPTGFDFADMSMISYFQLWLSAVLAESFFLKMFYRRKSWNQIIITSVVMNVVAYAILYVVFVYINS